MDKAHDAFRTISEVADDLDLPQHVLRFWETKFIQIKPLKRGGGRRYYRPDDVDLLRGIRYLLYGQGYTIKGVQRIIKDNGPKAIAAAWNEFSALDLPAVSSVSAASPDATAGEGVANSGGNPDEAAPTSPPQRQQSLTGRAAYRPRADVSIMRGGLSGRLPGRTKSLAVAQTQPGPVPGEAHDAGQDMATPTMALSQRERIVVAKVMADLVECRRLLDAA